MRCAPCWPSYRQRALCPSRKSILLSLSLFLGPYFPLEIHQNQNLFLKYFPSKTFIKLGKWRIALVCYASATCLFSPIFSMALRTSLLSSSASCFTTGLAEV